MKSPKLILSGIFIFFSLLLRAAMVTVSVGNGGNFFSPSSFTINPGDTVKWVWSSGFHNTSNISRPAGASAWYSNMTSVDTSFYYVASVSGLYTYTCTHHSGMDGNFFVSGCSFPDKPVVSSVTGSKCLGDTIELSVSAQPGVSYQWIEGASFVPLANAPSLKATRPGFYRMVVNRCGVDSISDPFVVVFDTIPSPAFSYSGSGLDYNFTNGVVAGDYSFLWKFGDGSANQTTVDAVHHFANPGQYVVTLVVTDTIKGCMDSVSKLVVVQPLSYDQLVYPEVRAMCDQGNVAVDLGLIRSRVDVCVCDLSGSILYSAVRYNTNQFSFPVNEKSGIYFIRIKIDNEKLVNLKMSSCN